MAKTIIMCKGLPASGKSTWAKKLVEENPSYNRVNKDDLREMLNTGTWSKDKENFVLKVRDFIIRASLNAGKNVIVDDTNFHPSHINRMKEIAESYFADTQEEVKVEEKIFDTSLEECLRRDYQRSKPVGEKVIRDMYKKYLAPPENICLRKNTERLPLGIICDLDGTLALLNGRDPYNASTCENDILNPAVGTILKSLSSHAILLVSGREDKYRAETEKWLNKNGIKYEMLLMRRTNDHRKDAIVKKEIYDEHIVKKYFIEFVLDDRQQVVDFWRSIGLTCLQVDYGNF